MEKIRIVVIDSGVHVSHDCFRNIDIQTVETGFPSSGVHGHGTAVCGIMASQGKGIQIRCLGIFDEFLTASEESLICALRYVRDHINCDIVHMSLGVLCDSRELRDICRELAERGIVLVAAFDNAGAVSYPAAYPFVIGVDASFRCIRANDFVFVENSVVNIRAKGGNQRVAWYPAPYTIIQGASFAAAYVTAHIAGLMKQGIRKTSDILQEFRKTARFIYSFEDTGAPARFDIARYKDKSVAVVPYNKEMHSILNFCHKLEFNLTDIYDTRYSGHVGLTVSGINKTREYKIRNIEECDFSKIDLMVVGHMEEMDAYAGNNGKAWIVRACEENGVDLYSFDRYSLDLQNHGPSGISCHVPFVRKARQKFGKLYSIATPVLGFFGTSKSQGKFTLQLQTRYALMEQGYHVGQVGSEPSAELFGMASFPFGYASDFGLSEAECAESINELMHELDRNDYDIILAGSQSGTVPMLYRNIGQIPVFQTAFLAGLQPDAVVLCVNIWDDVEYVMRTIKAIEGFGGCRVILLAIYPLRYENGWNYIISRKTEAGEEDILKYKECLREHTKCPVIEINKKSDEEILVKSIVEYFG